MSKPEKGPKHCRDNTHKKHGHWNIHIARSLAIDQPELEKYLEYIRVRTNDFVRYKPVADLCVNLVLMDNILPKIFGTRKFEKIPRQRVENFETELNQIFEHNPDRDMPIADKFQPFSIHGTNKKYLSLQLGNPVNLPDIDDYPLASDKNIIIQHIVDNYDVPKIFIKNNLIKLNTHIKLGSLALGNLNLSPEEQDYLVRFPSDYIYRRINTDNQYAEQYLNQETQLIPDIPSKVSLNGLRAVCEARDKWRLVR